MLSSSNELFVERPCQRRTDSLPSHPYPQAIKERVKGQNGQSLAQFFSSLSDNLFISDQRVHRGGIRQVPLARLGTAEEVVGAAIYLSSEAASYVTGGTLCIDGGWLAQ